jgi:hypothetical protein
MSSAGGERNSTKQVHANKMALIVQKAATTGDLLRRQCTVGLRRQNVFGRCLALHLHSSRRGPLRIAANHRHPCRNSPNLTELQVSLLYHREPMSLRAGTCQDPVAKIINHVHSHVLMHHV